MAAPYTVDASVFLNAFSPREAGHRESHQFLARLQETGSPILAPALLLPEVAGAIGRGHGDVALARRFTAALRRLPHLILIPLDVTLAEKAADLAARRRLRGSDAVYAAVALQFGSTLVTLDLEQRRRLAGVLPTRLPGEEI
jgi:predicted nucleic acid-binding protein